jgi:hypothetical protein
MIAKNEMNNESRIQQRAAARNERRAASRPRLARLFALGRMHRRSMFAPLAAFASLAGTAGVPFVSF